MCLSTAYRGAKASDDSRLAEYVTSVEADEAAGVVRLYDVAGEMTECPGRLRSVDLIRNAIFIE